MGVPAPLDEVLAVTEMKLAMPPRDPTWVGEGHEEDMAAGQNEEDQKDFCMSAASTTTTRRSGLRREQGADDAASRSRTEASMAGPSTT